MKIYKDIHKIKYIYKIKIQSNNKKNIFKHTYKIQQNSLET